MTIQASNAMSHQKLELIQYDTCVGLTRAIRGTSKGKLYDWFETLGLEFFQHRRWHHLFLINSTKMNFRKNFSN